MSAGYDEGARALRADGTHHPGASRRVPLGSAARERADGPVTGGDAVIALPEAVASGTPTAVLTAEFAGRIPADVVERIVAAAKHALERAHLPSTPATVTPLARDRLRARADVLAQHEAAHQSDDAVRVGDGRGYLATARPAPARVGSSASPRRGRPADTSLSTR